MALPKSIFEADITSLTEALSNGSLTSVSLVSKYLFRISKYDCRNTSLNSIPLLNENVFQEAQASDARRAAGKSLGPLDGIPFTVKDSYMVKDMTLAAGSVAFKDLQATSDSFAVQTLRSAGAIVLGRTNMCPMAYGGMLRGVYGRAESPYNASYLTAAFGSGSSNGSGTSTAASFASFGLGGETVSSGRSPASNNALVAYTPSRGTISVRGSWPLYPTCDVTITHTRTTNDLFSILGILTQNDEDTTGDFWRSQPYIAIPDIWSPLSSPLSTLKDPNYLQGKQIAVPSIYLTQQDGGPYISPAVYPLWQRTKQLLESAGAIVTEISEFPVFKNYEAALLKSGSDEGRALGIPDDWNTVERGILIAYSWEYFLRENKGSITSLVDVEPYDMFPKMSWNSPQLKFTEPANMVQWEGLREFVKNSKSGCDIFKVGGLREAVLGLEKMRKKWYEGWMEENGWDFVVFPAVGDVGREDAEENMESAEHAWRDGVKYSHGNRAVRHLGIPSLTVPMGVLREGMPIGLTILGRAYQDAEILKAGWAFEEVRGGRERPGRTPELRSDVIEGERERKGGMLELSVEVKAEAEGDGVRLVIKGTISGGADVNVEVFVDGEAVPDGQVKIEKGGESFVAQTRCARPAKPRKIDEVVGQVARDSIVVMVMARSGDDGWPAGSLKLVHTSEI